MTETPLDVPLIQRLAQAARYALSGVAPNAWFGPDQPLAPLAPDSVAGRKFDYPVGYNTNSTPRSSDPLSFEDLRALADNCDILRSVIETRKDQMEALNWNVRAIPTAANAKNATEEQKTRIATIIKFLNCPDGENNFSGWLRQILEDMFVIDAVCLYKRHNRAGGLYSLDIIDGATIKILIDDSGRLPIAPDPAYQQVLKGVPAADYTRDELIYLKHNPRSHKIYGYSHVEQVMITVNILIRRALHQLEYYREGSQPDAFIGLPKEWNQEQIVAFQRHFDAMLVGNLANRRRLRFMPGEFKYQETKPPPLKDDYDDFLARIICFVFSISPEPFISHVNRATAESSQARAIDEGLAPLQQYVCGIINRVIAMEFNSPDLEFVWQDTREQDPKDAASIDVAYVGAGIMTVDEVRSRLGLEPLSLAGGGVLHDDLAGEVTRSVDGGSVPPKISVKKNLRKDDAPDDEDEEDDDDDEEEGDEGDGGSDGGDSSDISSSGDSDFNSKHPRWPGGSPDGTGGEFAPKGSGSGASDAVRMDLSAFDPHNNLDNSFAQAFLDANKPSASASQEPYVPEVDSAGNPLEGVDSVYPVEDAIAFLAGGEVIQGIKDTAAVGETVTAGVGSLIGQVFGKLGTVVENPILDVNGLTEYATNRVATRSLSVDTIMETVSNPDIVLQQSTGRYLYLSDKAAVVVSPTTGKIVTAYPSELFDDNINYILNFIK